MSEMRPSATDRAAQVWCTPYTSHIEMDVILARVIAEALEQAYADGRTSREAEIEEAVREEREECASTAESFFPAAHTYASENAERYRVQDETCRIVANAIRARSRKEGE